MVSSDSLLDAARVEVDREVSLLLAAVCALSAGGSDHCRAGDEDDEVKKSRSRLCACGRVCGDFAGLCSSLVATGVVLSAWDRACEAAGPFQAVISKPSSESDSAGGGC
jgi:hypothetical protein